MSNRNENTKDGISLIRNAIKAALIGLVITITVMLGLSALMLIGAFDESLMDTLVLVAVIIGATVSGLSCAGKQGRGVVIAGLAAAAAYAVLVIVLTILFGGNNAEPALTLRVIIASVAGGCFGGVLKLHKKRKKSRLRR